MEPMRVMDAYCASCETVSAHTVTWNDPGSCACNTCGESQPLFTPLIDQAIVA